MEKCLIGFDFGTVCIIALIVTAISDVNVGSELWHYVERFILPEEVKVANYGSEVKPWYLL